MADQEKDTDAVLMSRENIQSAIRFLDEALAIADKCTMTPDLMMGAGMPEVRRRVGIARSCLPSLPGGEPPSFSVITCKPSERRARPFPWNCPICREETVNEETFPYVKEDVDVYGTPKTLSITLTAPRCSECREILFVNSANDQVTTALCELRGLLTPQEIDDAIDKAGMTRAYFAESAGIHPEVLDRWCNYFTTQDKAMDNYLRIMLHACKDSQGNPVLPPGDAGGFEGVLEALRRWRENGQPRGRLVLGVPGTAMGAWTHAEWDAQQRLKLRTELAQSGCELVTDANHPPKCPKCGSEDVALMLFLSDMVGSRHISSVDDDGRVNIHDHFETEDADYSNPRFMCLAGKAATTCGHEWSASGRELDFV